MCWWIGCGYFVITGIGRFSLQKAVETNALQVLLDLLHFQSVLFYAAFVTSLILPTMLPDFETSCGGGDECLSSYPSYFILKSWDFETLRLGGAIQLVFVFIPPRAAFPAREHTHIETLRNAFKHLKQGKIQLYDVNIHYLRWYDKCFVFEQLDIETILFSTAFSAAFPGREHTHTWKLSETLLNTSHRERYNYIGRKYTLFALAELMFCIRWVTWQRNHLSFQHNGNNFPSEKTTISPTV